MKKVLVIGINGMLGHKVAEVLDDSSMEVHGSIRTYEGMRAMGRPVKEFDILSPEAPQKLDDILHNGYYDWVINCAGVIKPHIQDNNSLSAQRAIKINSIFPFVLSHTANKYNVKVIQIATDCVFNGENTMYLENSPHDAYDIYGKTKSLGEVHSDDFYNIRCSIVGPEKYGRNSSLYEWVKRQPRDAVISGFETHMWNGITTKAFGDVCKTIIHGDMSIPNVMHLVPANIVSKSTLVEQIAQRCGRDDITIIPQRPPFLSRVLHTNDSALNSTIWYATYGKVPTIEEMIKSL